MPKVQRCPDKPPGSDSEAHSCPYKRVWGLDTRIAQRFRFKRPERVWGLGRCLRQIFVKKRFAYSKGLGFRVWGLGFRGEQEPR